MTFRCIINEIRQELISSLEKLGYHDHDQEQQQKFDITEPARNEYGDLACNVAFQLSKTAKKRPIEIANEIVQMRCFPV